VNSLNNNKARHVHVRAVVTYPAVTVALVASMALALTSFAPSQISAFGATTTPAATSTTTPTATATTTPTATTTAPPTPAAAPTTSTGPTPTVAISPAPTPVPGLVVAPGAAFSDHHVLARIQGATFQANYLPVDEPVLDASPFQTFRVRFRVHNAGTATITATPRLEFRPEAGAGFAVVPQQPEQGIPFYVAREWIPSLGLGGGTKEGPLGEDITAADLRIGTEGGLAMIGHHSMGANPDRPLILPAASYTEEEFTVKVSIDAKFLTSYELRITDAGTPLTGTDVATIRLGAPPAVHLSPDQHQGVAVVGPKDTKPAPSSAGSAFPSAFAAHSSATSSVAAVPATVRPKTAQFPLMSTTLATPADPQDQIHGPYSMATDKCGICHRIHTAPAPNLMAKGSTINPSSQSALCLSCHNGLGANPSAQFDLVAPGNVAATREYYSHDAVDATPSTQHTQSQLNEFGSVDDATAPLNRHSECTDCHNPHKATVSATRDATQNTDGWGVSGRLAGVSGASVVNSEVADTAPTSYTFLDGVTEPVTREYQICFKCHSGFTTLTSNADVTDSPSKYALDKAVEFNPANTSFHPVEAAGKNTTPAMAASLAGASNYKLWDFKITSTIRCLNCHASSATPGTPLPQPGSALAPRSSSNRGILIRNYQDRVLKPNAGTDAAYSAGDFALCYVCHGQAPFGPPDAATAIDATLQTNFSLHSKHLTGLTDRGPVGTDIDTAGDGGGNAICAECHFRLHSTTNKVGAQTLRGDPVTGSRLVNFAPNVTASGGATSWESTGIGSGSCTLTCHGHAHSNAPYSPQTP
jgi:predicted CXXCH cytochrome family protein